MSVEQEQLAALRTLAQALLRDNRFYGRRLRDAGLDRGIASLGEFRERFPFTTKEELALDQAENPPWGTNLTDAADRYTRFSQTSATTGEPLVWPDTAESWSWMLENWKRVYQAAGLGPGDRLLFAFSFGPFLGFWTAFDAAVEMGLGCLPAGGQDTLSRLRIILGQGVTAVCCTPTYASRLVDVARENSIDLGRSRVCVVIVAGEAGGSSPPVRRRFEAAWPGARLFDHYGMTEVGPVAHEDPSRPGVLRVLEDRYLAEVIDPASGRPAAEGAIGELVLTTLGRRAHPVLRYRTGDLVRFTRLPTGADAGALAFPGGILGRSDDMVVVRGVNVHPSAVDAVVRSVPEVTEYEVEVARGGSLAEISLRVETRDGVVPTEIARRLERMLRGVFSLRIPVVPVPRGSLPRHEMKARRWRGVGPAPEIA